MLNRSLASLTRRAVLSVGAQSRALPLPLSSLSSASSGLSLQQMSSFHTNSGSLLAKDYTDKYRDPSAPQMTYGKPQTELEGRTDHPLMVGIYENFFRFNSTYAFVILICMIFATNSFDSWSEGVWGNANKGKSFQDMLKLNPNLPPGTEDEEDEDDDDDDDE